MTTEIVSKRFAKIAITSIAASIWCAEIQAASLSTLLDESNRLPDGVNYLSVILDDEGNPGDINFTVDVLDPLFDLQNRRNFGIQSFAFNLTGDSGLQDYMVNPANWILPEGWNAEVAPPPSAMNGFGRFDVKVWTNDFRERTESLTFSITGLDDMIADYFAPSLTNPNNINVTSANFAAIVGGIDANGRNTAAFGNAAAPIPVPAAVWLFGSAIIGLTAVARRRSNFV